MMGNARTVTSEKDIGNREQGIVILLFFNHKVPKGKHKGPQRLIREICENSWNEKSFKNRRATIPAALHLCNN